MLAADAVDLLHLAGAEALGRIETPDSPKQPLPPQDLVAARNAAVKIIGDVEECAVAVGDAGIERQQIGGYRGLVARGAAQLQLFYRARGPHPPEGEQAAAGKGAGGGAGIAQGARQSGGEQEMIVIVRI